MAYATLEKLQKGWRALGTYEVDRAEEMLERASTWLDAQTHCKYRDVELSEFQKNLLSDITCSLVVRAWEENDPVTSEPEWAMSTNPYEQRFTPANRIGDFYLTRWEKKALGANGGIAFASFQWLDTQ